MVSQEPPPGRPPVFKPPMSEQVIALPTVDITELEATDLPFTRVLETRRSVREHGDSAMTIQQLGEFLYRSARVKALIHGDYEATVRPYPSAGALYPLEIYPIVLQYSALADGLYHYDPLNHRLEKLATQPGPLEAFVGRAIEHVGGELTQPQTLLAVTARVERVAWKYEQTAWPLIYLDTGVLFQTFYLVATAMGLAPCAVGTSNPTLFAEASGVDRAAEPQTGAFWLGKRSTIM
jgi:oxazoline/thiazoline dehydrogenase